MLKRKVARFLGGAVAAVAALGMAASAQAQEKKIKIGVIYDLTGPRAGGGSELNYTGAKIMIDNFIKQGVDPDQVNWAVNMLNMLEQNPREVYDRIGQYYQFNGQQQQDPANGQGQQNQQLQDQDPYAERFTAAERQLRLMTDYLVQQREQQAQAEADRWLDEQMAAAEKKYGKFDDKFVAAQMAGGMTIDQAVQAFQQLRQKWGAPPPPPLITGAGGGIANMNTDVRKMNDQDTHNLAVQMINSAFRQDAG